METTPVVPPDRQYVERVQQAMWDKLLEGYQDVPEKQQQTAKQTLTWAQLRVRRAAHITKENQ